MAKEQGERFTRREFFKGIAALGAGVLLGGCGPEKAPSPAQSPSSQPTPEPTKTPFKTPTIKEATTIPTLEPTPTKEQIIHVPGITITEELLKKAFAGIGGGETLANGQGEETTLISFGHDYVSQSWGKEIDFKNLSEDPVASLQYIVSLGSYQGTEGVFSPGKRGEETIFLQLADLSFPRITLDNVLSKAEQEGEEYQKYVSPQNFEPREGTQMTVIGLFNEPQLETGIIIDKDALGGELNYALVAFTDYLRVSEEGVPRHYFAILPTHFPADPENKNTLTLKNLLEANGYQYDHQTQQITFDSDNGQTALALNQIKGEELTQEIKQAVGLYFVDQVGGKLVNNPIVPYYEEMPAVWEVEEIKDEEGNITSLLLKGQDQEGEMTNVAQARYDEEKGEWRWQSVESNFLLELARAPEIEGLKAYLEENKIVYRAEASNPYGLEIDAYAGEIVSYTLNQSLESGVGLVPSVLEVLLKEHQTPEALREKREKFPLPFDPREIEFEMKEIKYPFITRSGGEYLMTYLGLNLPVGTSIYCPVTGGEFGGSKEMMFVFNYNLWLFPTPEREEELGEKCLSEDICGYADLRYGKRLVEPSKVVLIRAKEHNVEEPFTITPFQIFFSWQSEVEADLYKAAEEDSYVFWQKKKESFMGRKLFILDTDKPTVKYAAPVNYPIVIRGRQGLTTLESLFKIDGRYVFILPKGSEK